MAHRLAQCIGAGVGASALIAGSLVALAPPAAAFTGVEVSVAVGRAPEAAALSVGGGELYVANGTAGSLSIIDTASNTVTSTITGLGQPDGVAVTPTGVGDRLMVTSRYPAELLTVDPAGMVTSRQALTGTSPADIVVSPLGGHASYISDAGGTVIEVNPDTGLNTSLWLSGNPGPLALDAAGAYLYVVNRQGSLIVIATSTFSIVNEIPLGMNLTGVALDDNHAYVSSSNGQIYIVNLSSHVVTTANPGGVYRDIALAWDGAYLYAANSLTASIDVIALPSGTWQQSIPLTSAPTSVLVGDPGTSTIAYTLARDVDTASRIVIRPGKAGAPVSWRSKLCSLSGRITTARLSWRAPGFTGDFPLEGYSFRIRKPSGRWGTWGYTAGVERRGTVAIRGYAAGDRIDVQVTSLTRAGRSAPLRGQCTVAR